MLASALNPGVRKREVFGWAMYDFANSGYTTVVLTAVFAAYFVGGVAGGADWATFAWTAALSLSNLIVMFTIPAMGAWADRHAAKKRVLMMTTVGCVLATAALATVGPGAVVLGMVLIVVSNVFFAWGESLVAAFLPELARPHAMGRVSGWGWSLGYVGGMLALGLSLGYVLWAQARGLPAAHFVPVTMLITAAVFAVAAVFTFSLLRERAHPNPQALAQGGLRASLARLQATWRQARHYRDFMWLMGCAVAYQGGVAVAITSQAAVSRLLFGMARDGKLPKVLAKVHPKHNTPHISIYLVAVLSLLICYLFINSVDTLTSLVNFGALSGFMLLHLTVINYYWRRQKSGQVVRHLICPVIGFIIVAAIMYNMGVDAQKLGLIWIVLGLVYLFFLNKLGASTALPDPSNG